MRTLLSMMLLLTACAPGSASAKTTDATPVELGDVAWGRDLDAAKVRSKSSGKPVLILFTEVPGCDTVRGFGKTTLKDPIVVEAIESLFEHVVIYNNKTGVDRKILKQYKEPTWNNPVVRIFNAKGTEIAPRFSGPYGTKHFVKQLTTGLKNADQKVPAYLSRYLSDLSASPQKALFSMYCFWTGESKLAQIPGVIGTSPGFHDGAEVVEVTFDTRKITYGELVAAAKKLSAADSVVARTASELKTAQTHFSRATQSSKKMRFSAKDDKHHLKGSRYRELSLTEFQRTRVNGSIGRGADPSPHLTPRQRRATLAAKR